MIIKTLLISPDIINFTIKQQKGTLFISLKIMEITIISLVVHMVSVSLIV